MNIYFEIAKYFTEVPVWSMKYQYQYYEVLVPHPEVSSYDLKGIGAQKICPKKFFELFFLCLLYAKMK